MNITKKSFTKLTLLVSISMALIACEDERYAANSCSPGSEGSDQVSCSSANGDVPNSDPGSDPGQSGYTDKGGVTGRVMGSAYWIGADVCLDINKNGLCDSAFEPTEKTYSGGRFSFSAEALEGSLESKALLLAVNTEQEDQPLSLYAPAPVSATAQETNITTYTTLVANETLFNPTTFKSEDKARLSLLREPLAFGDESLLQGADYIAEAADASRILLVTQVEEITESFRSAQSLGVQRAQHEKAIAAVIGSMYKNKAYAVTVNTALIEQQKPLGGSIESALSQEAVTWKTDHDDEISVDIDAAQKLAVVGSQYHNRLIVFDLNESPPKRLSKNLFASSDTERDEVDGLTGATEQTLSKIQVTPDALGIVVAVTKYKSESDAKGVGIYRANLSNPSKIPFALYAEYDANSEKFYAFPNLTSISLSSDGNRVALVGSDKKLAILNTHDFSLLKTIDLGSKASAVVLDTSGATAYVSLRGVRTGVVVINTISGDEISFFDTDSKVPTSLVLFSNDSKVAWSYRKGKTLSIYDSSDTSDLRSLSVFGGEDTIKGFDLSPDGTLAVLALKGGVVELHSISSAPYLVRSYSTELGSNGAAKPINAVVFTDDSKALVSIKNGIHMLSVSRVEFVELSEEEKATWIASNR